MKQGHRGPKPRAKSSAAFSDPQDTGYTACEPDRSYFYARRAPAKAHDAGSAALTELHISAPDLEHPRRTLAGLRVKHVNEKAALRAELEACFPRWYFQLRRAAPRPAALAAPRPSCYICWACCEQVPYRIWLIHGSDSLPVCHTGSPLDVAATSCKCSMCQVAGAPAWPSALSDSRALRAERCREGFSLLLYGFGSKRSLLERFAVEALLDGGVLSVNGLCRGLSVRALLLRVASAMRLPRCLGLPGGPQPGAAGSREGARARGRSVCRAALHPARHG